MKSEIFLRCPDVVRIVGLAKPTIYQYMREGTFPRPIKIGPRAVAWRLRDIRAWQQQRIQEAAA